MYCGFFFVKVVWTDINGMAACRNERSCGLALHNLRNADDANGKQGVEAEAVTTQLSNRTKMNQYP